MEWPEPVERVAAALRAAAVEARLEELPAGASAADGVGCEAAQIVESVVFAAGPGFVLALVPGDRRADAAKVARAAGAADARVATADEIRALTGGEPRAVAPFPVPGGARVLLEQTLLAQELIWVGAGSPRHLAELAPVDLLRVTAGTVADLVG